jgi:hypothetical protein
VSSLFKRTFSTSLSNDELILFDALFDVWDTPESLLPENFATAFNLAYTHDLDGAGVRTTIQGLIERGLIQCRVERTPTKEIMWLALTAAGGELWALEREPVWERFCQDASWPAEPCDGSWTVCVRSPSLETARAFLETSIRCGLYDVSPQHITEVTTEEALIPWRGFSIVYELRAPLAPPESVDVDWARYERERRWWRTVSELDSLELGPPRRSALDADPS